jgi:hypothetical protein
MKTSEMILIGLATAAAILLFLFSLPFILVKKIKAAIRLRMFRRREAGYVYLICTSKRNWHDFLKNNVIPILPDNFRVVWQKPLRSSKQPDLFAHLARSSVRSISKPCLVVVTPRALLHRSLNVPLQPLKAHSKRSADIRLQCARIINELEGELRTCSGANVMRLV